MMNLEKFGNDKSREMNGNADYLSGGERRRKKAEKLDSVSLSHWLGDLHVHTKSLDESTPGDIAEKRYGSNCGEIPLEEMLRYHSKEMLREYVAITEHSRDANPAGALEKVKEWFEILYCTHLGVEKLEYIGEPERKKIIRDIDFYARQLVDYDDERMIGMLEEIDKAGGNMKVFKGVEVNLMSDSEKYFDTDMVEKGKFELVNCAIHPKADGNFEKNIKSKIDYSRLVIKGIKHPKTNVMCHIGFGMDQLGGESLKSYIEGLDWENILAEAVKNKVAVEINLKELMDVVRKEWLKKNEKGIYTIRDIKGELENKLPELLPIVFAENQEMISLMKKYFKKGLKIAINTDEHKKLYQGRKKLSAGEKEFVEDNFRFWRIMKLMEKKFNNKFEELGIKKENIINTYSIEKLSNFLSKKD